MKDLSQTPANIRRRRRAAKARAEIEAYERLGEALVDAGMPLDDLPYAILTDEGAAILSGQPEHPVRYLTLESGGWVSTQYQSADFACRAFRAARQVAQEYDLGTPMEGIATVDQVERALRRLT